MIADNGEKWCEMFQKCGEEKTVHWPEGKQGFLLESSEIVQSAFWKD